MLPGQAAFINILSSLQRYLGSFVKNLKAVPVAAERNFCYIETNFSEWYPIMMVSDTVASINIIDEIAFQTLRKMYPYPINIPQQAYWPMVQKHRYQLWENLRLLCIMQLAVSCPKFMSWRAISAAYLVIKMQLLWFFHRESLTEN